ncbi:hypothetical protein FRC00_003916 [Tulasnella sp. 408]|nr:hypothetical protein FRC00_003916 [Tulasnella sp. 408]
MGDRLVGLALSRSSDSPLTITGELSSSPGLDKLLQHAYRWKVLNVKVLGIDTMDRLASLSVPLLAELRISPPISHSPLQTILFNGSAPMLRIACILDCAVGWSTSLFSNLQELVLDLMEDAGCPDVDTFLKLLSQSPKLTRLEVQNTLRADEHPLQPRVSLPCLQSLTLEYLEKEALYQVLNAIDIPTSTECSFSLEPDPDDPRNLDYERLKPIDRRLAALAEVSRGTKSTLTFGGAVKMGCRSVWTIYEGGADRHGALIVDVEGFSGRTIDFCEHFARQLGQGEPNPIPPILHLINCSNGAYGNSKLELLQILHRHLPDTDEILIEDTSFRSIGDAFNDLFPLNQSSGLFSRLSTLTVRNLPHDRWVACWLRSRQEQQDQEGGSYPLPLQTFRIEGGTISAEMVEVLEKLVPNLVLDRVKVKD